MDKLVMMLEELHQHPEQFTRQQERLNLRYSKTNLINILGWDEARELVIKLLEKRIAPDYAVDETYENAMKQEVH